VFVYGLFLKTKPCERTQIVYIDIFYDFTIVFVSVGLPEGETMRVHLTNAVKGSDTLNIFCLHHHLSELFKLRRVIQIGTVHGCFEMHT
jgi:hypothetical protein